MFLQLGAFIARYFRERDPWWFKMHRAVQSIGLLFALGGFITAFVGVLNSHLSFTHAIIGTVVMVVQSTPHVFVPPHLRAHTHVRPLRSHSHSHPCVHAYLRTRTRTPQLALLQPVNAFFRPHKGEKHRRPWEWLHKGSGRVALVLALVNITLGVVMIVPPDAVFWSWISWLIVIVIAYVVMESRSVYSYKSLVNWQASKAVEPKPGVL